MTLFLYYYSFYTKEFSPELPTYRVLGEPEIFYACELLMSKFGTSAHIFPPLKIERELQLELDTGNLRFDMFGQKGLRYKTEVGLYASAKWDTYDYDKREKLVQLIKKKTDSVDQSYLLPKINFDKRERLVQQRKKSFGITHQKTSLKQLANRKRNYTIIKSVDGNVAETILNETDKRTSTVPDKAQPKKKAFPKSHLGHGNKICSICGIAYSTNGNLNRHMLTHKGVVYTCDVCGRSYSDVSNLREHQKRHDVEGHHVCPICNGRYHTQSDLAHHKKLHAKDDLKIASGYCLLPYCDAITPFKNLNSHLSRKHHIHNMMVYKRRISDLTERVDKGFTSDSRYHCNCREHHVWIFKWEAVGKKHSCYMCECPLAFFRGAGNKWVRMCKYRR